VVYVTTIFCFVLGMCLRERRTDRAPQATTTIVAATIVLSSFDALHGTHQPHRTQCTCALYHCLLCAVYTDVHVQYMICLSSALGAWTERTGTGRKAAPPSAGALRSKRAPLTEDPLPTPSSARPSAGVPPSAEALRSKRAPLSEDPPRPPLLPPPAIAGVQSRACLQHSHEGVLTADGGGDGGGSRGERGTVEGVRGAGTGARGRAATGPW